MPPSTAEMTAPDEARSPGQHSVLYGPVQSRRLGFSLGVDLLPAGEKVCNFDCLYCECGWTPWMKVPRTWFPSLEALKRVLTRGLPVSARRHPSIDTITFSGHGEPTLFPEFPAAVNLVRELGRKYLPWARLAILTNGTLLGEKALCDAVRQFDVRCVKLDAGSVWMNRPRQGVNVAALLPVWAEIPNLTLQSFFSEGRFDNTRREWVDPWVEQVKVVKPRCVQLYTLDRSPAAAGTQKASLSTLNRIGRQLASEVGTEVQVFE